MAKDSCSEPPPVTQGWYTYSISIARGDSDGYEWRVTRGPEMAPKGQVTIEAMVVSHGTARSCDEARRKAIGARETIMAQYTARDAYRTLA